MNDALLIDELLVSAPRKSMRYQSNVFTRISVRVDSIAKCVFVNFVVMRTAHNSRSDKSPSFQYLLFYSISRVYVFAFAHGPIASVDEVGRMANNILITSTILCRMTESNSLVS